MEFLQSKWCSKNVTPATWTIMSEPICTDSIGSYATGSYSTITHNNQLFTIIMICWWWLHWFSCQVPHPLRASVEHRPEGVTITIITTIFSIINISINHQHQSSASNISITISTLNIFLFFKQVGRRGSSRALHLYKQPFPQVPTFLNGYCHDCLLPSFLNGYCHDCLWEWVGDPD